MLSYGVERSHQGIERRLHIAVCNVAFKMQALVGAAAPVSVALNLLLDGPFGAAGAAVALLATEATVPCIELWCARDVLSSFVLVRDLARMALSNVLAVLLSAVCAWSLAIVFSAGPGATAIVGLLVYSAVDIAVAVVLRDETALMLAGKVWAILRRG